MAFTSGRIRPPSPPPPPSRLVSRRRTDVDVIRRSLRRHGKDIYEYESPPGTSEDSKRSRILVQDYQELSSDEKDLLQFAASLLFHSKDPNCERSLVIDFAISSIFQGNPLSEVKELWNFCARQYPTDLSLMLARHLNSSLPSAPVRTVFFNLLHLTLIRIHGHDRSRIDESVLVRDIRPLLLNVIKSHESASNILDLSAIVAKIFEFKRWRKLLLYLSDALRTDLETKQEMALRVITILPEMREECLGAYKFWWDKHESLKLRFIQLFGSPNLTIKALTFDASVKLVRLLHRWRFYDEIDDLLQSMIWFLRTLYEDGQTDIVEPRIMEMVELARYYSGQFLKRLDVVLDLMFQIAVNADDNTFLKSQAIQIVKTLDEKDMIHVSQFIVKLSNDDKRSIFENCVRMMLCIADAPGWYDTDTALNEYKWISGSYYFGKYLLFRVCLVCSVDTVISLGREMIPQYLNSEDWQKRHAGMLALAAIGSACGPVRNLIFSLLVLAISSVF